MSRDGHSETSPEDRANPKSDVRAHGDRLRTPLELAAIHSAAAVPAARAISSKATYITSASSTDRLIGFSLQQAAE